MASARDMRTRVQRTYYTDMKLVSYRSDRRARVGVAAADHAVDLDSIG